MNWFIKTAFAAENFLARIVPICDPSDTNPDPEIPDCDLDQLLLMGQNIVTFLITTAFVITVFFIVIGAFRMIVSGGNEKILTAAKGNITSAIIGLLIVLTSWVVLNTAIDLFKSDNCTGEWWKFESLKCGEYISPLIVESGEFYCKWVESRCTVDVDRINCRDGFNTREEQCEVLENEEACSGGSFSCRVSTG